MVHDVRIDPDSGMATVSASGPISIDLMQQAFGQILQHADFRKDADALWDLREAEFPNVPTEQFLDLVRFIQSKQEQRGSGYKVAIVVTSDFQYGLARMYEAHAEVLPADLRVFRDMDKAQSWLAGALS